MLRAVRRGLPLFDMLYCSYFDAVFIMAPLLPPFFDECSAKLCFLQRSAMIISFLVLSKLHTGSKNLIGRSNASVVPSSK